VFIPTAIGMSVGLVNRYISTPRTYYDDDDDDDDDDEEEEEDDDDDGCGDAPPQVFIPTAIGMSVGLVICYILWISAQPAWDPEDFKVSQQEERKRVDV
jgi:hypothetical protein